MVINMVSLVMYDVRQCDLVDGYRPSVFVFSFLLWRWIQQVPPQCWTYLLKYTSHSRGLSHWKLTKHMDTLMLQYYQSGKRLHIPNGCPTDIYRLILECWDMDPYRRKKPQAIMRDVNQILYQGILFQRVAVFIPLWGFSDWSLFWSLEIEFGCLYTSSYLYVV